MGAGVFPILPFLGGAFLGGAFPNFGGAFAAFPTFPAFPAREGAEDGSEVTPQVLSHDAKVVKAVILKHRCSSVVHSYPDGPFPQQ